MYILRMAAPCQEAMAKYFWANIRKYKKVREVGLVLNRLKWAVIPRMRLNFAKIDRPRSGRKRNQNREDFFQAKSKFIGGSQNEIKIHSNFSFL